MTSNTSATRISWITLLGYAVLCGLLLIAAF